MVIKRETKRNFRKVTTIVFLILGILVGLIALILVYKLATILISYGSNHDKLIRPLGQMTTVSILKEKLSDKNIIMDSLSESSDSAVLIGVVRDGPKVLFSNELDPVWEAESVALILQKTTVDNKKPSLIDLTTNRPIVKF